MVCLHENAYTTHIYIQAISTRLEHEAEETNNRSLHLSCHGVSHRQVEWHCRDLLGRSAVQAVRDPLGPAEDDTHARIAAAGLSTEVADLHVECGGRWLFLRTQSAAESQGAMHPHVQCASAVHVEDVHMHLHVNRHATGLGFNPKCKLKRDVQSGTPYDTKGSKHRYMYGILPLSVAY
jgi:hypothetical protein